MGRKPHIDKNGMKKGAWSQEEDDKLRAYILRYGHWNWRQLPKFAGLSRCGKSCRLRWLNYLRQNVKKGKYTKDEEDLILKLRDQLGNRWSVIAAKLPGRTDNEIKNYWHSNLKKRVKQNSATSEVMDQSIDASLFELSQKDQTIIATSEGNPLFPESSSTELSSISFDYAILSGINGVEEDCITSFESNPNELHVVTSPFQANQERELTQENFPESHFNGFLSPHFDHEQLYGINWLEDYGVITPLESYFESTEKFWTEPFLSDESHNQSEFLLPSEEGGFMSPYYSYYDNDIEFLNQIFMEGLSRN